MAEHADLIGVPFAIGARGPDAYDCYGLVREMYRRAHGVEIEDFRSPEVQMSQHLLVHLKTTSIWRPAERAAGVVAAIRIGRLISHCGFLLDANTMLHAWERSGGVTAVHIDHEWERRIVGYYRYAG